MATKKKVERTPAHSEGARLERRAFRNMLRRRLSSALKTASGTDAYQDTLDWVLARQKRYDKKAGGL